MHSGTGKRSPDRLNKKSSVDDCHCPSAGARTHTAGARGCFGSPSVHDFAVSACRPEPPAYFFDGFGTSRSGTVTVCTVCGAIVTVSTSHFG